MLNSTTVGWMPEPQVRGTVGLIWSCLATIFICTWSALHLNISLKHRSIYGEVQQQGLWVFVGLFAPEWLTYFAFGELMQAWQIRRRCPKWSLKKCFFLIMGGFAVRSDSEASLMSSIQVEPLDLLDLFEGGELAWPECEDSDIDARTQGDVVVKLIALSQLMWFIAQVVGRAIDGRAVTTLELFTLGNVLCSVFTYIVWWNKPYRVRAPIVLDNPTSCRLRAWDTTMSPYDPDIENTKCAMAGVCVGISFGALHLVAWRFHFPSETERLLWQICSVVITITSIWLPLVYLLGDFVNEYIGSPVNRLLRRLPRLNNSRLFSQLPAVLFLLPACLYIAFRLYILVEMFAALRNVPEDVYSTPQWTQYFPAFG